MISTHYSDTTPDVAMAYYRDGSLRQVTDGAGVHTYDGLSGVGLPTRETIAGGGGGGDALEGLTIEQSVDGRGRKTAFTGRFTMPGQASVPLPVVSYAYQDGWVGSTPPGETIAWNYAGSPEMRFVRGTNYDGTSKRHQVTIQRSLGGVASFKSTTETDAALGTVQVSHQHGSATPFQSRTRTGSQIDHVDPDITTWPTAVAAHERWSYGNDMRGQITSASKSAATTPGSASVSPVAGWSTSYAYDDIGNRKSVSNGQIEYTTNAVNQYTSIANTREFTVRGAVPTEATVTVNGQSVDHHGIHFTKTLQAGGNGPRWENVEIEASQTVGGMPQTVEQAGQVYVPPAAETLVYDEDGNLVADGAWTYTWDGENRLVGMSTHMAAVIAGVPQTTLAFAYDYQSRRVAKTVSKYVTAQSAWRTTSDIRFINEGWNLMAEVELLAEQSPGATGQAGVIPRLFRSFVWGPDVSGTWEGAGGVGGLLGMTGHQSAGQVAESYIATWDLNGNVICLCGAGDKLALYDYDAFGQVLRANESGKNLNPFRFSTRYVDVETGLSYYGYRYYDSAKGRWLSEDPIQEQGGVNVYGFCENNAIKNIDQYGHRIVMGVSAGVEALLKEHGVNGYTVEMKGQKHEFRGNAYQTKNSVYSEILAKLISSPREFRINCVDDLKRHVRARELATEYALKTPVAFATGDDTTYNESFWTRVHGSVWKVNEGVAPLKALKDFYDTSSCNKYAIPCKNAAWYAVIMGQLVVEGGGSLNGTYQTTTNDQKDWIPGDWGMVVNSKFSRAAAGNGGTAGENIVYLGKGVFFGHNPGERVKSLSEWVAEVQGWAGGAYLDNYRKHTLAGLILKKD